MPNEDNKILKYDHGEKSLKFPFIIYADLECLSQKMRSCQNNLQKSNTERKNNHTPSGYSWYTVCSFDATKRNTTSREMKTMKKLCEAFRNQTMIIINYEEKEMIPLTDKETKSYEKQKASTYVKNEFWIDENDRNTFKLPDNVRDHCHYTEKFRGAAHRICNFRYKTPKEILVVFHNGSTYDYHFIIKQLAKEFEGQFEKKNITFSAPIKKELGNSKTVTYKLKFVYSLRFFTRKLSDLVDNSSEI